MTRVSHYEMCFFVSITILISDLMNEGNFLYQIYHTILGEYEIGRGAWPHSNYVILKLNLSTPGVGGLCLHRIEYKYYQNIRSIQLPTLITWKIGRCRYEVAALTRAILSEVKSIKHLEHRTRCCLHYRNTYYVLS